MDTLSDKERQAIELYRQMDEMWDLKESYLGACLFALATGWIFLGMGAPVWVQLLIAFISAAFFVLYKICSIEYYKIEKFIDDCNGVRRYEK